MIIIIASSTVQHGAGLNQVQVLIPVSALLQYAVLPKASHLSEWVLEVELEI